MPVYAQSQPSPSPLQESRIPSRINGSLDASNLSIMYVILVHDHPEFVERIVQALHEPQHTFAIHIDKKADHSISKQLFHFSKRHPHLNINFVDDNDRQIVVWGAYSIVNATLSAMRTGWASGRHFDYLVLLSGTSYPIKSNKFIRETLARTPNAVYMEIVDSPSRPSPEMWHHFVECDGALHRIGRLSLPRGINMHIGSQWFAIPKHLVEWYLFNELPQAYAEYAQHVIVADENYFQTLFKNSPYCEDHVSKNFLFVLFDKWENERVGTPEERDPRKCLNPHPDFCGRSPTTLTMAYRGLVQVSRDLFARKFNPTNSSSLDLVTTIDQWREIGQEEAMQQVGDVNTAIMLHQNYPNDAKGVAHKCLQLGAKAGDAATVVGCDPTSERQWFNLGPCTTGANITISDGQCALPHPDEQESFCQLQSSHRNLCLDISGESPTFGNNLIAWECTGHWNQLFRLGSDCSISAVQPDLIGRVRGFNDVNITLCLETTDEFYLATSPCQSDSSKFVKNVNPQLNANEKIRRQRFNVIKRAGEALKRLTAEPQQGASISIAEVPDPVRLPASRRIVNYNKIPSAVRAVLEESDTVGKPSVPSSPRENEF